jgi:hypothetical protein
MLVAEHRDRSVGSCKHTANLLKEKPPGVKVLVLFIPGVISMLPDDQHTIHCQLLAAKCQSARNALINRNAMLPGEFHAYIILVDLVQIHGNNVDLGYVQPIIAWEPLEKFCNNNIRV